MNRKHGGFLVLLIVALLVMACGPTMATPTPPDATKSGGAPTAASTAPAAVVEKSPTVAPDTGPTAVSVSPGDLPVSSDDWHVLGPADAKVILIEYSDFQ
jgi:protein-disulfide isomerase